MTDRGSPVTNHSQSPETVQGLIRRKTQALKDTIHPSSRRQAMDIPVISENPQESEALWSQRYTDAVHRYEGLDLCSPEASAAVIDGLQQWRRLVPQRSVGPDGLPEPANKWGLGAERCVLRALHSHLVAVGQPLLAARIHSEMADLLQTAESLDECCARVPPDRHAEKRLIATARIQTKALVKLLSVIQLEPVGQAQGKDTSRRRRGARRRHDPDRDRRLMDEWAQVRGKAGMTRKEYCALKGISLRTFIQTQDRFRKQSAERADDSV